MPRPAPDRSRARSVPPTRSGRQAPRRRPAVRGRILLGLALLASSLAPALVAPATVSAQEPPQQPLGGVTVGRTTSVTPYPDYVRVGWSDSGSADPTVLSVRANDELVFTRCATPQHANPLLDDEQCVKLTATCGTVFDDMESLHELLDGLAAGIKQNWESQKVGSSETPGTAPGFKLPEYSQTSAIELDELLQAAWPLLPARWRFLNWDAEFVTGVDLSDVAGFARTRWTPRSTPTPMRSAATTQPPAWSCAPSSTLRIRSTTTTAT